MLFMLFVSNFIVIFEFLLFFCSLIKISIVI